MTKYLAWITGLRGPEAQLWNGKPVDGTGKPKKCLAVIEISDDDNRNLNQLIAAYPAPAETEDK